MEFLFVFAVVWALMIGLGFYVGEQKGRGAGEAFLLTILFGPFGILILVLLPNIPKSEQGPRISMAEQIAQAEAIQRYNEKQQMARMAEREAYEAAIEAGRVEKARRREARRQDQIARGITPGPLSFVEEFIAWFKSTSDLAQALMLGLAIAVPAGLIALAIAKANSPDPPKQAPSPPPVKAPAEIAEPPMPF